MVGEFEVRPEQLGKNINALEKYAGILERKKNEITDISNKLSIAQNSKASVKRNLQGLSENLETARSQTASMQTALSTIQVQYKSTEKEIVGRAISREVVSLHSGDAEKKGSAFWDAYGWEGLLAGSNYIGTIYKWVKGVKEGKTWEDFAKLGVDAYQFLSGAARTFRNYKKIGNAVGTKTAMGWWFKNITGLKALGRASTAKNPVTRFVNNLTNKTSPFNAQFKNVINNFKGKNGLGKAVSSWGAVAANGVLNWFSNKEEQANSNGTMSDGRVLAETITETAVDTALTYGAGIVVGAAVTTVIGAAAAPGIVVTALSGAIIVGANVGIKALTGKTATEWISDTILDTGEALGKAVGSVAKNVSNTVGSWFGKIKFA